MSYLDVLVVGLVLITVFLSFVGNLLVHELRVPVLRLVVDLRCLLNWFGKPRRVLQPHIGGSFVEQGVLARVTRIVFAHILILFVHGVERLLFQAVVLLLLLD